MKKIGLLISIVFAFNALTAQTFSVAGINYSVTSGPGEPPTIQVGNNASFSGAAIIPSSVTYSGVTHTVTGIGNYAFFNCTGITSVSIPSTVIYYGLSAFGGCSNLSTVTVNNSVPVAINDFVFPAAIRSAATLMVPVGAQAAYAAADYWKTFGTISTIPPVATHLNFDGTNDYVSLPASIGNSLSNGTAITIEYWFKGTNLQSGVRLQNGNDYIVAGWGYSTNPSFIVSTDGGTNGISCGLATTINDNQWHHLAFVWKKNEIFATYLDGVLQNDRIGGDVNLPVFSGVAGTIGSLIGTSEFMQGNIDEVRIWNTAITASDIARRRSCELVGNEAGLLAYYKFNQGTSAQNNTTINTLTDATAAAQNGALTGFALSGTASNWLASSPVTTGSTIPTAPTATAQSHCNGSTVANLTPAPSSLLKWYSSATSTVALATTELLTAGSYYAATVNANGCESERTTVTVTINTIPTATATAQVFCASLYATVANLIATGTNVKWYSNSSGGSVLASSTVLSTANYYVSQTIGGCESARTAVSVTVNTVATPTVSNQNFCNSANATIASLVATGTAVKWYAAETGGATLPNTTLLQTKNYYASQTISSCESVRTLVSVVINRTLAPMVHKTQVFTGAGTIANLSATGTSIQWYAANTGGSALSSTTNLVSGTNYYASQTTACGESNRSISTVQKISESSQSLCSPATVSGLVTTTSVYGTAKWFSVSTGGTPLANTASVSSGTYYAEESNNAIVSTILSGFYLPNKMAIQSDGTILFSNWYSNSILKMNADGSSLQLVKSGFSSPSGIAIQTDGKIVVADAGNNAIKRMNADGTGIETIGTGFNSPFGVAIQADGKIIVADYNNNAVKRMNTDGSAIETIGTGFNRPSAVAIQANGKIVVANNNAVKRMNTDGTGIEVFVHGANAPTDVFIENDGNILIAESGNNRILRMSADGTTISVISNIFGNNISVVSHPNGRIIVADVSQNTISSILESRTSNRVAVTVTAANPAAPTTSNLSFATSTTVASFNPAPSTMIKWYSSANGGASLLSNIPILANATYYASAINANGCESERTAFPVTVLTTTWNGTGFTNGTPINTLDVQIGSNTAPPNFTAKALIVNNGFSLTTTGITATVNGNITNNGNGIAGTGGLTIAANSTISGNTINFNGTLTVNSGATLTTNNLLTLTSTATNTARIAPSLGSITGNVTVQRFFPGGNSNGTPGKRGFRFLSHPFNSSLALTPLMAIGNIDITGAGGATNGFTNNPNAGATNSASAFWYNPTAAGAGSTSNGTSNDNGWIPFTTGNGIADGANPNTWNSGQGIRVLFRGAKGEGLNYSGSNYTLSDVTLSLSGAVNMGNQTFTLPAGGNDQWSLIGNPYASPINVRSLLATQRTGGLLIGATAYVYNPNKVGSTRGGYDAVDVSSAGSFALPAYGVILVQNKQATSSSINMVETDKTTGADVGFRTQVQGTSVGINLVDASNNELLDEYNLRFSNTAHPGTIGDIEDGGKLLNNYSLYSMSEGDNKMLQVDSRPKPNTNQSDSKIRLGIYSSTPRQMSLQVSSLQLPGNTIAYLKDNYLHQEQAITNTSYQYIFSTTADTASQGNNRFELVFKQGFTLPVTFTQVKAQQQANGSSIQLSWQVANEVNLATYEVEESKDGLTFNKATTQIAQNRASYSWEDNTVQHGNNFYRIKAIDKTGSYQYSQIVNVRIGKEQHNFSIYPNPVRGGVVNIQFSNVAKGEYTLQLYNSLGQVIATQQIEHLGGTATQSMVLGKSISQGSYNLVISNGESNKINKTVIIE